MHPRGPCRTRRRHSPWAAGPARYHRFQVRWDGLRRFSGGGAGLRATCARTRRHERSHRGNNRLTTGKENSNMEHDFRAIHKASIVIDGTCPLVMDHPTYIDWYREGGTTAIAPTVGGWESARNTLTTLSKWTRLLATRDDLITVRRAADVELAKRTGKMGIFLHFQGTDPIEGDLDLVYMYKALGVGVMQLTYNVKNRVGDGCEERTDAGLSKFGVSLVRRLNEAKVIVDCSHTGHRTSLDAIEHSTAPVILSHANARAVHDNRRNVRDELIKAIANSGGIIGANGFPAFVAKGTRPSVQQFIAHIDHVAELERKRVAYG